MDWSWPQIIAVTCLGLHGFVGVILHGKSRGEFNGTLYLADSVIWAFILGWGGFWK